MNSFALQNYYASIHAPTFLNLHVLKYRESKIFVVKPQHFWISKHWHTEIQKSPCFGTRRLNFV